MAKPKEKPEPNFQNDIEARLKAKADAFDAAQPNLGLEIKQRLAPAAQWCENNLPGIRKAQGEANELAAWVKSLPWAKSHGEIPQSLAYEVELLKKNSAENYLREAPKALARWRGLADEDYSKTSELERQGIVGNLQRQLTCGDMVGHLNRITARVKELVQKYAEAGAVEMPHYVDDSGAVDIIENGVPVKRRDPGEIQQLLNVPR
jgi:hypothetical protein